MIYQNRKVCVTWNEFGKQKKAILFEDTIWTKLLNLYRFAFLQKIQISNVTIKTL